MKKKYLGKGKYFHLFLKDSTKMNRRKHIQNQRGFGGKKDKNS